MRALAKAILERAETVKAAASQGQPSPVLQSYQGWDFGTTPAGALPRTAAEFLLSQFGPSQPPYPAGIDPVEQSGRPLPRRYSYPVGWNLAAGTPGTEGLKLASFATLRYMADVHSVTRACITIRVNEILGLNWDIVATEDASVAMKGSESKINEFQDRRRQAVEFFKRPDPNYPNFHSWLGALLEEHFVIDAISLYIHPPRVKGKGLLGSDVAALDLLDGSTIRPLLNSRGETPRPPQPAYQAYEWGYPRVDLMTPFSGRELDMIGDEIDARMVDEFRGDQLLYLRRTARTFTPYGFSPVEQALIPATTQLRKQQFRLEFFTEGSIPGIWVVAGEGFNSPQQLRQLQDALNAVAGDQSYKHKIQVLPPGSSTDLMKPIQLAGIDDEFLYGETLMAFSVQPMELGIMPKASNTGPSSGAANQMAKVAETQSHRKGLLPLLEWLADSVFNYVLHDLCQQHDMEWKWLGLDSQEDEQSKADRLGKEIGFGLRSVDEARAELGLDPWGDEMTATPLWATLSGVQALAGMSIEQPAPVAIAPEPGQDDPAGGGETPHEGAAADSGDLKSGEDMPTVKMLAEVETLRRLVKKGRTVGSFRPVALKSAWFERVQQLEPEHAVTTLRRIVKADDKRKKRDKHLAETIAAVTVAVAAAGASLASKSITRDEFVEKSSTAVSDGLTKALALGTAHAAATLKIDELDGVVLTEKLAGRLEKQRDYLLGFGKQIQATPDMSLDGRAAEYGSGMVGAYEDSYGSTVTAVSDEATATWICEENPCSMCDARDGVEFSADELPGWPGDGGFADSEEPGEDICEGGPLCRCTLEWDLGAGALAVAAAAVPQLTKDEDTV